MVCWYSLSHSGHFHFFTEEYCCSLCFKKDIFLYKLFYVSNNCVCDMAPLLEGSSLFELAVLFGDSIISMPKKTMAACTLYEDYITPSESSFMLSETHCGGVDCLASSLLSRQGYGPGWYFCKAFNRSLS